MEKHALNTYLNVEINCVFLCTYEKYLYIEFILCEHYHCIHVPIVYKNRV